VPNICSDKIGTLAQNELKVVAGVINAGGKVIDPQQGGNASTDLSTSVATLGDYPQCPATDAGALISHPIPTSSTACQSQDTEAGSFVGSKTEAALSTFARRSPRTTLFSVKHSETRVMEVFWFDRSRQCMIAVV
jgi:Ca2+-transporting ATPase